MDCNPQRGRRLATMIDPGGFADLYYNRSLAHTSGPRAVVIAVGETS